MCGIAGMVGVADERLLSQMLSRTRHRGPDDTGMYLGRRDTPMERIALGSNRLSILDLSLAGHQPMSNEDASVWVVYNGEIYNFPELRKQLISQGHHLRSRTDSEILPHLYEQYGATMVNRLNGMFAFALWDERMKIDAFRDHGLSPWLRTSRLVSYFAPEIKAPAGCRPSDLYSHRISIAPS
jgi:asparagine synthase (glutamine-hydrolysing)